MKKITIVLLLFLGCSSPKETTKKYTVVSSFNEILLETDSKEEAYETAHNLTLMSRVFSSKPFCFVVENNK